MLLVGYRNHKKDLHYYRCLKCKGVHLNAITTQYAVRRGANDLFIDLLNSIRIPFGLIEAVKWQLAKYFNNHFSSNTANEDRLKSQLAKLEEELKELKIRHGRGRVDKDVYDLTLEELTKEMQQISKELGNVNGEISNLENLIETSLNKLRKLATVWTSSNLENKRKYKRGCFQKAFFTMLKNTNIEPRI